MKNSNSIQVHLIIGFDIFGTACVCYDHSLGVGGGGGGESDMIFSSSSKLDGQFSIHGVGESSYIANPSDKQASSGRIQVFK